MKKLMIWVSYLDVYVYTYIIFVSINFQYFIWISSTIVKPR